MTSDSGKEPFRLGFLTAIEVPERGFVGGLLVTNHFGRPLEFQCTAPLKPNRTQEILYGPTLVPYVLGDLIGRTLIDKLTVKPNLVLTERDDLLSLRDLVCVPIACVEDAAAVAADGGGLEESTSDNSCAAGDKASAPRAPVLPDASHETREDAAPAFERACESGDLDSASANGGHQVRNSTDVRPASFRLGRQLLRFHEAHEEDELVAQRGAAAVPRDADLREPFERVREALHEAAQSGGSR